jgi:hypothetical protein
VARKKIPNVCSHHAKRSAGGVNTRPLRLTELVRLGWDADARSQRWLVDQNRRAREAREGASIDTLCIRSQFQRRRELCYTVEAERIAQVEVERRL